MCGERQCQLNSLKNIFLRDYLKKLCGQHTSGKVLTPMITEEKYKMMMTMIIINIIIGMCAFVQNNENSCF